MHSSNRVSDLACFIGGEYLLCKCVTNATPARLCWAICTVHYRALTAQYGTQTLLLYISLRTFGTPTPSVNMLKQETFNPAPGGEKAQRISSVHSLSPNPKWEHFIIPGRSRRRRTRRANDGPHFGGCR